MSIPKLYFSATTNSVHRDADVTTRVRLHCLLGQEMKRMIPLRQLCVDRLLIYYQFCYETLFFFTLLHGVYYCRYLIGKIYGVCVYSVGLTRRRRLNLKQR